MCSFYICIYVYIYMCIYAYMYLCIYVYLCACIFVYMHILCIYAYMCIYMCIYAYIQNYFIIYIHIIILNLYWIYYNVASVLCFGFLAKRHAGSWCPIRDQTCALCMGRWSLKHCTAREVLKQCVLKIK